MRLGEPVWWQRAPTVRFHFSRQKSFNWRVCYHTDLMLALTDHTRISIDLRVLPESERERMRIVYRGTGRRRMSFAPGHYYDERLSSEI